MCTLTYIPIKYNSYIITSNRDESISKLKAIPPAIYKLTETKKILYPKDPEGGGTWIAASSNAETISLMNGAFGTYKIKDKYRLSRGKIVLEKFLYKSALEFLNSCNFHKIAPFTMILIEKYNSNPIYEAKWDENQLHIFEHDKKKAHIFNSPNLFSTSKQSKIKYTFESWLEYMQLPDQQKIIDFHMEKKLKHKCGIFFNKKNKVKTLSTTSILINLNKINMIYIDHISNLKTINNLNIN